MSDEEVQQPEPPNMAWLLTFADLVSLLITFFVLLYSMKVVDTQKWEDIKGSFSGVFSIKKPVIEVRPDKTESIEKVDFVKADNLDYVQTILGTRFKNDPVLGNIRVKRDFERDRMIISMPSVLLFDAGGSKMLEEGEQALYHLGDVLRHLNNRVDVAGHTDPSPTNNSEYPTNWELAMSRAIQIAVGLEEQGVNGPIPTISYGSSRFYEIDPDAIIAERYAKARRVDIIIHGQSAQ